jgi:BolA family transcriptional regulator, general stress-responsive regulator
MIALQQRETEAMTSHDLGPIGAKLYEKLAAAFQPGVLQVIDESHQHHGHSGAHPSGESHFRVIIRSRAFQGMTRVQQHRAINLCVAEELSARVHALAIDAGC